MTSISDITENICVGCEDYSALTGRCFRDGKKANRTSCEHFHRLGKKRGTSKYALCVENLTPHKFQKEKKLQTNTYVDAFVENG